MAPVGMMACGGCYRSTPDGAVTESCAYVPICTGFVSDIHASQTKPPFRGTSTSAADPYATARAERDALPGDSQPADAAAAAAQVIAPDAARPAPVRTEAAGRRI